MEVKRHECDEGKDNELGFSVENRGAGWYLYKGNERGANPINFCPFCGMKLSPVIKEESSHGSQRN